METREFLYHLYIIRDLIKNPHIRIILLHPPYTIPQQRIIDSISRQSKQIIGQVERKLPMNKPAQEIERLITACHEPFIKKDQLQYVIVGRQKNPPQNFN